MSPTMRTKIERNIAYHMAMQKFYKDADKKEKEDAPHPTRRGAQQHDDAPPRPAESSVAKLAEMHGEVAEQLQQVLNADQPFSAIDMAQMLPRPHRSLSGDLKPKAGVFH